MIQCFLLLGLQLQVLPSNARKSIHYCLTERHSRRSARLNHTKVYGKISQRILLTYAITQILGNGWRMRTTTPAVDTRPSFFAFRLICRASVVANILCEKFGPGDEAMQCHTVNHASHTVNVGILAYWQSPRSYSRHPIALTKYV